VVGHPSATSNPRFRAVAAELFISANTAGVHVSRILAKLRRVQPHRSGRDGAETRVARRRRMTDHGRAA
jgi:DNA-binding NarL/FixJ family response regulator